MNKLFCNIVKKAIIITFPIYVLFMFFPAGSSAQAILRPEVRPAFELIDREDGLSNLSVSSIVQDKNGFLWFGTQMGLNRYDGREIKTYKTRPFAEQGLIHNLIQTMYYDEEKHELWIGTYQGLSRFNIAAETFISYPPGENGLSNSVVVAITKDSGGNIWVGTLNGLNILEPESGKIERFSVPGNVVRALHFDNKNNLYVGSYEGLLQFSKEDNELKKIELELPSPFVMAIKEYEEGVLSLGLWDGGLCEYNLMTGELHQYSFTDNRVYSILQSTDGTKWVGTWGGGLFAVASSQETFHFSGSGGEKMLSHPVVYSLFQDQGGILWIGTNGGGINKLSPRRGNYVLFEHDSERADSLSQGKINSIYRDSKGRLWVAVYNSGIERFDQEKNSFIKYGRPVQRTGKNPLISIMAIIEDRDNRILVATDKGVASFDENKDDFVNLDILPQEVITYALALQGEDKLWIGTYTEGLYLYNEQNEELKRYFWQEEGEPTLSDNLIYAILVDSKDRVWVGTNNGLNLLEPGEDKFLILKSEPGNRQGLASNTVRTIMEDSEGRIWIGMVGGGVAQFNETDGSFKTYTESEGLSGDDVTALRVDKNGRIWVGTHNGISILDPKSENIINLNPSDGIGGWEFSGASYADEDGSLIFGGIHGLTVIPAEFSEQEAPAPLLYITEVSLFQKPLESENEFFNREKISVNYGDKLIGFRFIALDYDAPDKITYRYRLLGFNQEWVAAGLNNYVSYSNLPPGEYRLEVQAETIKGVRSAVEWVDFTVSTPWFRHPAAYFLYLILLLTVAYAISKLREGVMLNRQNSELFKLNQKLEDANKELEGLSTKDSLTGLFNRRYFDQMFEEHLNLAKRSKAHLSLIMLDLDHFKSINDDYGHQAGDDLLCAVAGKLQDLLPRSTDFVARYGGDEFVISLYDTDENGALVIAEILKDKMLQVKVKSIAEKEITLSMGVVSVLPDLQITAKELVSFADKALYGAKEAGRNQIKVYNEL